MTVGLELLAIEEATVPENEPDCENYFENDVKEFTDIIGSDGRWQRWIFVIVGISGIPVAWNHLVISFFAFPSDFRCIGSRDQFNQLFTDAWLPSSVPNESVHSSNINLCHIYHATNDSTNNFTESAACSHFEFEFPESRISIIKQWDLVCDRSWMPSASQSAYMGGFLASAFLSGQMADTFGRHPVIMFNVCLLLVSGTATAFSTSFVMFCILRVFVAMGHAGLNLTAFVLLVEVVGVKERATYALTHAFGWHIGYCLLPLMAYHLPTWYHLQLAITLPSLTFLSFYWTLPESPRWLLAKGRLKEAVKILEQALKMNKKTVPDLENQAKKFCRISKTKKVPSATALDLLKTPNLRKNTLILYFSWCVIAFVYYGLSLNLGDLGGNLYLNVFLSGFVEVPATIACVFIVKWYGRKIPFMVMLATSGLACFGCIFTTSVYWLHVTIAMIGKLLVSCSFSVVFVYSAEIYPTVARNVGVGTSSMIARVGTMVSPFMKELSQVTSSYVPLTLFAVLSLVNGGLVWFLPETKGYPVPETLQDAEEFKKKDRKEKREEDLSKTSFL